MAAPPSVTILGSPVPVHFAFPPLEEHWAVIQQCVAFKDWLASIEAPLVISSITIQSVDMFGPRVGFLKLMAEASLHGKRVPGIVFLRGGAVSVLTILTCEGERYVVCCRQPRVPSGKPDFLELPAGMLDGDGNFKWVAAKELKEETGIEIKEGELKDMTAMAGAASASASAAPRHRGMYPSIGGCDEFIRLMFFTKEVTRAEIAELQGKATGVDSEQIILRIIPYDDLWKVCADAKALSSMILYEKLGALGML